MARNASLSRWSRIAGKALLYGVAFTLPIVGLAAVTVASKASYFSFGTPAQAPELPAPPAYDPAKPTVVVLAGNEGTEITDFMGPYSVFSAAEEFNVFAVAPHRQPSLLSGGLTLVPHYSLEEYDSRFPRPDVVVIPYIPKTEEGTDQALVPWIRQQHERGALTVSICAGASALAQTGLLEGRRATTHASWFERLERRYPNTTWVRDVRYVDDGDIVASQGITSGIDTALHVVDRLRGRETALKAAAALSYPHTRFLDDPHYVLPSVDATGVATGFTLRPEQTRIAVALYDGVDELSLGSIYETYPNSGYQPAFSVGAANAAITSRHGLHFVSAYTVQAARGFGRLLVPGSQVTAAAKETAAAIAAATGLAPEYIHQAVGGYPYDATLQDLAARDNLSTVRFIARGLEYPVDGLTLQGQAWPFGLLLRTAAAGLMGVVALRWWRSRRSAQAVPAGLAPQAS